MTEHGVQADPPEIDEIVNRLEFELKRSRPLDGSADREAPPLAARVEAERLAGVTADRPYAYKPGWVGRIRGLALLPAKVVLRKLMRWYVEPVAADQRAFNTRMLRLTDSISDSISERIDAVVTQAAEVTATTSGHLESLAAAQAEAGAKSNRLATSVEEHDDRLLRLERRPAGGGAPVAPGARAPAPAPNIEAPAIDYFAFESRMRGPRALIVERQRQYVEEFRNAAPVLDVGCGRGEFLSLLAEAGVEARGVDLDPDMVAFSRSEGLDVEQGDAIAYLDRLEDESLGGVFAAQFVEHLKPGPLTAFLGLAASKLRHGGVLVLETINPLSLFALRNYFADLTHAQPLIPETLSLLVKQAGFGDIQVRLINEPTEEQQLEPVELPPGPEFDAARQALESNRARLNDVVFGAQDYTVVARH